MNSTFDINNLALNIANELYNQQPNAQPFAYSNNN